MSSRITNPNHYSTFYFYIIDFQSSVSLVKCDFSYNCRAVDKFQ